MRAAGYVRVSTARQVEEGWSLGEQERRVRAYADSRGWQLVEVFVEAGVSGRRDDRPELGRLLDRLDELDVLVVPKLDRLGRSTAHLFRVLGRLDGAGVRFVSIDDAIDTSTASGKLLRTLLTGVAEFEVDRMSERIRDGMAARRRAGRWNGGRAPFGYRGEAGGLVVDVEQAVAVRSIFDRFVAGSSQSSLARDLNRARVATACGGQWGQSTVRGILANPIYTGRLLVDGQLVDGLHEAIVDRDVWEAAQRQLGVSGSVRGRGRGRPAAGPHLFRGGLLRCACGATMGPRSHHRDGRVVHQYACRAHLRDRAVCPRKAVDRALVDEAVYDYFAHVALDVEATRATIVHRIGVDRADVAAQLERAERDRTQRREARGRVEADYLAGDLSGPSYDHLCARLAEELAGMDAEVGQLAARLAQLDDEIADAATAADDALLPLAELRARIAEQLREPERVEGVRAALGELFESFTLLTIGDADPVRVEADLELRADERSGDTLMWLDPHPRADAIEALAALPWEPGSEQPYTPLDYKLRRVPLPSRGRDEKHQSGEAPR